MRVRDTQIAFHSFSSALERERDTRSGSRVGPNRRRSGGRSDNGRDRTGPGNLHGKYVDHVGAEASEDVCYDDHTQRYLCGAYRFGRVEFFLQGINLTNDGALGLRAGRILATDQHDQRSVFHVFDRVTLSHLGALTGGATANTGAWP